MEITTAIAKEMFEKMDRDYYSWNGLDELFEYYDEIDPDMDFDPIAICCDCSEFGGHGAALSFDDMINDYGYIYPVEEWLNDNDLTSDEYDYDLYINDLIERIENETTVLHVCNGNYIIFAF